MRTALLLLLCVTQLRADERPSVKPPQPVPAEQAAVTAIEALGGRVSFGSSGRVTVVILRSPNVTNEDLKHLQPLTDLRLLSLSGENITDAAIVSMQVLTQLRSLRVSGTSISEDGIKQLKSALPNCRILSGSSRPRQSAPRTPRRVPDRFTTSATTMVNRIQVLVLESVREELGLTDDQRQKIDAVLAAWTKREEENTDRLRKAGSREEGRDAFGVSRQDADAAWQQIREILSDQQEQRFEQLKLQKSGLRLFVVPPQGLFTELEVSADQRQQLAEIYEDWNQRYGLPARGTKSWDTLMDRLLAVFTPEQRRQWDAMTGEPFDFRTTSGSRRVFSVTFPNLGTDAKILKLDWVRDDLGLTPEQSTQITAELERWQQARNDVEQQLRSAATGGDGEKARESTLGLTDTAVEITDQLTALLTDDQRTRLGQLQLQTKGIYAFFEPAYLKEMKLNSKQRRQLYELSRASSPTYRPDNPQPAPPIEQRRQLMTEALELLTDEQRESWLAKVGKPAAFPDNPYGNGKPSESKD